MSTAESGRESYRPQRTELVWEGKRTQVERIVLPFQVVETINVSRATREETPLLAGLPTDAAPGTNRDGDGWRNKLIWGDNKYVLASLLEGDPAIGLEPLAGKVDLIYIDPPFDTGDDFSLSIRVGDADIEKQPSILEELAYRDTWGRGLDSYLQWFFERVVLLRELLRDDGSIYVHLDWHVAHYVKVVLDQVLGAENFRNEIIWRRARTHNDPQGYGRVHDTLLFYTMPGAFFDVVYDEYGAEYVEKAYRHKDSDGRRYQLLPLHSTHVFSANDDNTRRFGDKVLRPPPGKYWRWSQAKVDKAMQQGLIVLSASDVPRYKKYLDEAKGVPAQSIWDDLKYMTADQMVGFPTQKPVALLERVIRASSEKGGIVLDCFAGSGTTAIAAETLGRRWIMCDLGRYAIQVSRKRLLDIPNCRPFEVLNLGKYERQHWQVTTNGHSVRAYLDFIVKLYRAESVAGFTHLHGRKAGRMVHVGATDAPVTLAEITDALDECVANNFRGLDVLGWEWEMGLHDLVPVEARKRGVDLRLLTIPREVMDKRAVEAGDVHFYELAYLDAEVRKSGTEVQVGLRNFIIPNLELIPQDVRDKIKRWSDYVDFWAVDWDYQGDTFHNAWQSYRTRKHPSLRLESDPHPYEAPGRYQVMVKVIDIFGNDTTKLIPVTVP